MFPTIQELRSQCRIDHGEEDHLLDMYLKAAIKQAENYLKRSLVDEEQPLNSDRDLVITDSIKIALIFVVGYWYDYRDLSKIPEGFYDFLRPYRIITI